MRYTNEVRQEIRADAGAWWETHGKIWPKDRSRGLITPQQNYLQIKAHDVILRMRALRLPERAIGLKPRQKGSTTWFSAEDYTHIRRTSAHACVIGGQYSQTREIWEMLRTYQANDDFDGWGNTGEINTKEGNWSNGSRLKPETAGDALAGISGTYQVLHATEVARWSRYGVANAGEVLANILKCVPLLPDTLVILESTAEGASGTFYERFLQAIDADDFLTGKVDLQPGQYVRIFAPWFEFADSTMRLTPEQKRYVESSLDTEEEFRGEKDLIDRYGRNDNGVIRLGSSVTTFDVWEQLAWRRWAIREECKRDRAIFDRDYPHSWQDAFMKSGNLRFNATGLSVLRKRQNLRPPMPGIIEDKSERLAFRQTEMNEAQVIIYERPTPGFRYLLPVDPMTGATQTSGVDPDKHAALVIRDGFWDGSGKWNRPALAARIVPRRWDIDVLEVAIWKLARYYGGNSGCKIAIEMNMDRGLTELLKIRGADLYQREMFNQREQKLMPALGFQTNAKTRENLIETLAEAIREWDSAGKGLDVFDGHCLEQLENFVVSMSGHSAAAEGFHDDDVLALALGLHLIEQATSFFPARLVDNLPPDLRALIPQSGGLGGAFS